VTLKSLTKVLAVVESAGRLGSYTQHQPRQAKFIQCQHSQQISASFFFFSPLYQS
jgi:hypothetical protein